MMQLVIWEPEETMCTDGWTVIEEHECLYQGHMIDGRDMSHLSQVEYGNQER